MGASEQIRAIARRVYDDARDESGRSLAKAVLRDVKESCWRDGGVTEDGRSRHLVTFDRNAAIFADVGGPRVWQVLLATLGQAIGAQGLATSAGQGID